MSTEDHPQASDVSDSKAGRAVESTPGRMAVSAGTAGSSGIEERLLITLERLLEVQPSSLKLAMDDVATVLAEVLGTEKVDAFLTRPRRTRW